MSRPHSTFTFRSDAYHAVHCLAFTAAGTVLAVLGEWTAVAGAWGVAGAFGGAAAHVHRRDRKAWSGPQPETANQ